MQAVRETQALGSARSCAGSVLGENMKKKTEVVTIEATSSGHRPRARDSTLFYTLCAPKRGAETRKDEIIGGRI